MPPLPAWYDGRVAVRRFFAERMFKNDWRVLPTSANGQPAVACYMRAPGTEGLPLSSIVVLSVRGRSFVALDGFLDPEAHRPFGLPAEAPPRGGEGIAADR